MSWIKGFNFRDSAIFVTDGADETHVNPVDAYPTPRNGVTFGLNLETEGRNRDAGLDRRLAGAHFFGGGFSFRVDLPAPGDYLINAAFGDQYDGRADNFNEVYDNATLLFAIEHTTGFTTSAQRWRDATDVLRNSTTDAGGAVYGASRPVTFATTALIVQVGSATRQGFISHLRVEQVEGGAPPVRPARLLLGVGA